MRTLTLLSTNSNSPTPPNCPRNYHELEIYGNSVYLSHIFFLPLIGCRASNLFHPKNTCSSILILPCIHTSFLHLMWTNYNFLWTWYIFQLGTLCKLMGHLVQLFQPLCNHELIRAIDLIIAKVMIFLGLTHWTVLS